MSIKNYIRGLGKLNLVNIQYCKQCPYLITDVKCILCDKSKRAIEYTLTNKEEVLKRMYDTCELPEANNITYKE